MLYACENQTTSHRLAKMNVATPDLHARARRSQRQFRRSKRAMDELAYALKMDPLQLRLQNYAEQDPGKQKPFSSKSLRACYTQGAERFGWSRRNPAPGSMRDGNWHGRSGHGHRHLPDQPQPRRSRGDGVA